MLNLKYTLNKTCLQPVSKPVEQLLGFFPQVKKRNSIGYLKNGHEEVQNWAEVNKVT